MSSTGADKRLGKHQTNRFQQGTDMLTCYLVAHRIPGGSENQVAQPGSVFEIMSQNWAKEGTIAAATRHKNPKSPTQGSGTRSGRESLLLETGCGPAAPAHPTPPIASLQIKDVAAADWMISGHTPTA